MVVEIVFATKSDGEEILSFINAHWQQGHIFTKDPSLFEWQHGNPSTDDLSFVLAREDGGGEILGILGYVPVSRYAPASRTGDLTLATWKVRDDCEINGLGVFLYKALTKRMKPKFIGVSGLSEMVVPIYKAMRFKTGTMAQHVFFNRDEIVGELAAGVGAAALPSFSIATERFQTIRNISDIPDAFASVIGTASEKSLPFRGVDYIIGRYCNHPTYHYAMSAVNRVACFIWRKITTEQGSCLRVVDYFGDADGLKGTGAAMQSLLKEEGADYIDIVHAGLDSASLTDAGFVDRRDIDGLVVPHYFEPFEQRNVDLDYALRVFDKEDERPPILLRGFTDQDRPNQVHAAGEVPDV
jgi:hypothetical protein